MALRPKIGLLVGLSVLPLLAQPELSFVGPLPCSQGFEIELRRIGPEHTLWLSRYGQESPIKIDDSQKVTVPLTESDCGQTLTLYLKNAENGIIFSKSVNIIKGDSNWPFPEFSIPFWLKALVTSLAFAFLALKIAGPSFELLRSRWGRTRGQGSVSPDKEFGERDVDRSRTADDQEEANRQWLRAEMNESRNALLQEVREILRNLEFRQTNEVGNLASHYAQILASLKALQQQRGASAEASAKSELRGMPGPLRPPAERTIGTPQHASVGLASYPVVQRSFEDQYNRALEGETTAQRALHGAGQRVQFLNLEVVGRNPDAKEPLVPDPNGFLEVFQVDPPGTGRYYLAPALESIRDWNSTRLAEWRSLFDSSSEPTSLSKAAVVRKNGGQYVVETKGRLA